MNLIAQTEIAAGVTLADIEKYLAEIGALKNRVDKDVAVKVLLLDEEKKSS